MCYRLQALVHRLWKRVPGEDDDYISQPKVGTEGRGGELRLDSMPVGAQQGRGAEGVVCQRAPPPPAAACCEGITFPLLNPNKPSAVGVPVPPHGGAGSGGRGHGGPDPDLHHARPGRVR